MGENVDTNFDYNAPKFFIDFNKLEDQEEDHEQLEEYFNFDHENGVPLTISDLTESPSEPGGKISVTLKRDSGDGLEEKTETIEKPVLKKQKPSNIRSEENNNQSRKRTGSMEMRSSLKRKGSLREIHVKAKKPAFADCPKSNLGKSVISSEQQDLLKMQELRQELAKKRKLAEKSCQKALRSQPLKPARSEVLTTKPEEFHFATDSRIKGHPESKQEESKSPVPQKRLKPTIPKPFNLTESKRKKDADEGEYVPMAVSVNQFSKSTPTRFRTRPHNKPPSPLKKDSGIKVTVPHTPNFQTTCRQRPNHIVSAAEKEEQEVQDMAKNQFKARPVNKKIFDATQGVKKVAAKPTTEIVPFALETNRPRTRSHTRQESKEREFHAQPFPQDIFKRPVGIKPVEQAKTTIPESPAFALRNRVRKHSVKPEEEEHAKKVPRVQPIPYVGLPFIPKVSHKTTEIQPFSFAEKDQERFAKKEERLRQMREHEGKVGDDRVGEFHATPLPDPLPDRLPEKKVKPSTRPEPFQLEIDMRGTIRSEQWSQKLEEELRQQKEAMKFKAQPSTVLHTEAFKPKKSDKVLLEVHNFELNTDKRAKERDAWEAHRKSKEAEMDEQMRQKQREEEERNQQEVERIRKEAVHKANTVRHYKPVVIHPSLKAPTEAKTPRFSERLKTRVRRT